MEFFTAYRPPEADGYFPTRKTASADDIEKPIAPIVKISDIGQTVTEGARFGTLIQSAQAAIRIGVGKIELQTQMGGGVEAVGAESYGKEARQALREMRQAAKVEFTSVHAPVQASNLSGFDPQSGFRDEFRQSALDEVKKAVTFAAETTGGGAVVIHTGEYQRPISEMDWAKEKNPDGTYKKDKDGNYIYQFMGYPEEPGRAITYMVDDRTGRIISDVRRSQVIREPIYREAESDNPHGRDVEGKSHTIRKGDWIDDEGKYINPLNPEHLFKRVPKWNPEKTRFETRTLGWKEIEERTNRYNSMNPERKLTSEEMAYRVQAETQMLQYRGQSLYHSQRYDSQRLAKEALKKSLIYYEEVEKHISPEDEWQIMQRDPSLRYAAHTGGEFIPDKFRKATEIIKDSIDQLEKEMQYTHESSASSDVQADTIQESLRYIKPISEYAMAQSMKSYAEAGIFALNETRHNPYAKKDIFIAPENIWPETGYGSHPDELIDLVKRARESMVKALTSPKIPDPYDRRDKDGRLMSVPNPNYDQSLSVADAKQLAEKHIKATLDTQHLGMWRKHFMPKIGESKEQTDKRFNVWYMDQIKKLEKEKVIGHMHLVDSIGGSHHHLPAGEGNLPLTDAVTYLMKKGYSGTIVSEAFGEEQYGAGRIMTQTWRAFGSPVYSMDIAGMPGPRAWPEMQAGYFGKVHTPYYVFGAYSPSNDYTLWSEVPLE